MRRALEMLFHVGPLVFAALFLWPLVAQTLLRLGVAFDTATVAGAAVALPLGLLAQWRGRWI